LKESDINKLIAEKVLGLEVKYDNIVRDGRRSSIPNYSQNIEQAWKVIEAMREKGMIVSIFNDNKSYFVKFHDFQINQLSHAVDKSISLAICKSALKVIGVEIK